MPSIGRYEVPPLSCLILYLQGCIVVVFSLWKPICAFWYGTRLEGDRSLLGLFNTYINNTAVMSSLFFRAAWENDLKKKRTAVIVEVFTALLLWVCSFFGPSKNEPVEKHERSIVLLMRTVWFLFLFAFITLATIELEEWRVRRRLQGDEERDGETEQSGEYRDQQAGLGRVWHRRGAISGVAGLGPRTSAGGNIAAELITLEYGTRSKQAGAIVSEQSPHLDKAEEGSSERQNDTQKEKIE